MPPIPFPLPFTIGTDICHIPRIFSILTSSNNYKNRKIAHRFIRKLLTEEEYEESRKQIDGALNDLAGLSQRRALILKRGQELGVLAKGKGKWKFGVEDFDEEKNGGDAEATVKGNEKETGKDDNDNGTIKRVGSEDVLKTLMRSLGEEEKVVKKRVKVVANFLAGRFAAKEAAIKAHTVRRLTYQDIAIRKQSAPSGMSRAPLVLIKREGRGWSEDPQIVPLSISHDEDYATAVCMACERPIGVTEDIYSQSWPRSDAVSEPQVKVPIRKVEMRSPPVPLDEDVWIKKFRTLKDGLYTRRVPRGAHPWR
ncbi:hypothetical protein B7463_g8088, partial [Scytalidium lignicola]